MKKSKIITLVLITAALASCNKEEKEKDVWLRSDESAEYTHSHCGANMILWYYAFRPYGYYSPSGVYTRAGYYSGGINQNSNIGHSPVKSGLVRGGFGGKGFSVSS